MPRPFEPLAFAALTLLSVGCVGPERATTIGAPVADSAERAMALTNFEAPVDIQYLIGLNVPPFPSNVERISTSLVHPGGDLLAETRWGLLHVRVGGRPVLLLITLVARTRVGNSMTRSWRVDDVVILPEYDAEDRVVFSCRDQDGQKVAALGVYRWDLRTVQPARAAWAIDGQMSKLVPVDPSLIRCGRR